MSHFDDVIAEAVKWFVEHGFTSEAEYRLWEAKIAEALEEKMRAPGMSDRVLRDHMEAIFNRLVGQGQILKRHPGVTKFTIQRIAPELRNELTKRIMASADLIKLNREEMRRKTLQRFSGWATSIPQGGAAEADRRKVKAELSKPLRSLPYVQRRLLTDQGHKLNASISAVVAQQTGAIAAKWFSHFRQAGYNYRPDHRERDGKIYLVRGSWAVEKGFVKVGPDGWSDDITQPAEEVFCFPASTRIPFADGVEVGYRRWFSGDLAEIVTASGKTLSATCNHPILTPNGWVAIGSLNEGDDVVEIPDEVIGLQDLRGTEHDKHNAPEMTIEEIFNTIRRVGVSEVVRGKSEDFHGDGSDRDIDVVSSAHPLRFGRKSSGDERGQEFEFPVPFQFGAGKSALNFCGLALARTSDSVMRGANKVLSALFGLASHSDGRRLFSAPRGTPGFDDTAADHLSGNAEFVGKAQNAFSRFMAGTQGSPLFKKKARLGGQFRPEIDQTAPGISPKGHDRNTHNVGDSVDALPFRTQTGRVVKVNRYRFSGHVFNLQTGSGVYAANYIVTHNCRCKWTYLYSLRQLPEDMLTEAGKKALAESRIAAA